MSISGTMKAHAATLNGVRIHWDIGGNGPPLVLLHGFPQTRAMWRALVVTWSFLRGPPLSETLIGHDPDRCEQSCLRGWRGADAISRHMNMETYRHIWRRSETGRAIRDDCCATLKHDLADDTADDTIDTQARLILPVLILCGARGIMARNMQALASEAGIFPDIPPQDATSALAETPAASMSSIFWGRKWRG